MSRRPLYPEQKAALWAYFGGVLIGIAGTVAFLTNDGRWAILVAGPPFLIALYYTLKNIDETT